MFVRHKFIQGSGEVANQRMFFDGSNEQRGSGQVNRAGLHTPGRKVFRYGHALGLEGQRLHHVPDSSASFWEGLCKRAPFSTFVQCVMSPNTKERSLALYQLQIYPFCTLHSPIKKKIHTQPN